MLKSLDDNVGRVLKALRSLELEERTLVFFISDNGGPTGASTTIRRCTVRLRDQYIAQPIRSAQDEGKVFEGGIRVPFLVRWRGKLPAGMTYDQPVSTLDLLPTVVAAADGSVPATRHVDGVDLLPFLQGEQMGPPHEILFWRFIQAHVRRDQWKLVQLSDQSFLLYDLAADIGETHDVAAQHPKIVADLRTRLTAWEQTLVPPLWREPLGKPETAPTAFSRARCRTTFPEWEPDPQTSRNAQWNSGTSNEAHCPRATAPFHTRGNGK